MFKFFVVEHLLLTYNNHPISSKHDYIHDNFVSYFHPHNSHKNGKYYNSYSHLPETVEYPLHS